MVKLLVEVGDIVTFETVSINDLLRDPTDLTTMFKLDVKFQKECSVMNQKTMKGLWMTRKTFDKRKFVKIGEDNDN